MRIQHNIMAMNAYRNYTNNVSAMQKNLEKLSSGYKINRAGDDAAGLAISEKMRAQITGLQTAQKNAKDGISLVQTAEGALTEVHDMLNRMVELATQSANGTYDNTTDRAQMQKEVDQLLEEINRIADSSNFNGINLLDGSLGLNQAAVSNITYLDATAQVAAKELASVVTFGSVHGSAAKAFQKPEVTINLQDVSFQRAGSTATKATITLNLGSSVQLTAQATLTASGAANATAIAAAFLAKYTAATIDVTASSGAPIQIGNAYYKLSGSKDALKLELVGVASASGSSIDAVTSSVNTEKFTESMANDFNTAFDVGASITLTASAAVGTVKNGDKIIHGTIQGAQAVAKTDIHRWGADINLDAKFMVDGNTLEIDGKVFTVALSSTANAHSINANGTVTISTKLAATASDQLKEFVRLMQGQNAGHFTVSAKDDNKLHFDARASQDSNATVQAYTASKVKALVKAKDAGAAAQNAGVKFTVDDSKFVKGDVVTVGGKSFVYQGSGTNGFASVGSLETKLAAEFGASKVTKVAATSGNGFTFTIRANTASAAAPMIQGRGLTLQIGDTSDSFNQLNVAVQDMHDVSLGIRNLKIDNEVDAQAAIAKIKAAINTVSDVRGTLGATQNRLDHTINNLSVMTENIQDAESTIRDTDVAEEMMAYTKNNILIQSAQAMLAQANQVPQGVLQLLQ